MKLNKKFLACFTAMTMVMAPMSVLAEDTHSITGDGSVEYLETEIYNLVLPTDECINFKVDPYGTLASTTQNDNLANVISNAAGTVTSSATAIINKSSVDLDVRVDLLFDQKATTSSNSAVKLATNKALAESGEADLYLTVDQLKDAELTTYAAASVTTVSIKATDTKTVTTSATTLTPNALVLSNSAVSIGAVTVVTVTDSALTADAVSDKALNITLKGVPYAYFVSGKSATLSEGAIKYNSDNVYAFKIGGYAYPQAEVWKNIAEAQKAGDTTAKLELTMKFTIAKADEVPNEPTGPQNIVVTKPSTGNLVVETYDTVSSIQFVKVNGVANTTIMGTSTYSVSGNTLTLLNSWVSKVTSETIMTLKFADGTTQTLTINVN